ncbi:MAG: CvpA family protein [Ignavibacteriae bacterium]|nr:CvpA family protein [Ignavibacteriota bacterium]
MVDIFIIAGLIISIALGFKDGFFRKLYGVLGFLGGLSASLLLYPIVGDWFSAWFEFSTEISRILAFAAVFIVFIVSLNIIYRMLGTDKNKTIKTTSRFAGGFIGAFQGAVSVSLLLILFSRMEVIDEQAKNESLMYDKFIDFAPQVINYTMKWLPKTAEFIEELKGTK